MTTSAPVLDETSDAARCATCSHLPGCRCPHWCEPEPSAPSLYLVQVPGRPDALLDPSALAVLLASGARPGGLYDVSQPGRKTPLVLARMTGCWQAVLPGEAGRTEPVTLAEFEISSDEESR